MKYEVEKGVLNMILCVICAILLIVCIICDCISIPDTAHIILLSVTTVTVLATLIVQNLDFIKFLTKK